MASGKKSDLMSGSPDGHGSFNEQRGPDADEKSGSFHEVGDGSALVSASSSSRSAAVDSATLLQTLADVAMDLRPAILDHKASWLDCKKSISSILGTSPEESTPTPSLGRNLPSSVEEIRRVKNNLSDISNKARERVRAFGGAVMEIDKFCPNIVRKRSRGDGSSNERPSALLSGGATSKYIPQGHLNADDTELGPQSREERTKSAGQNKRIHTSMVEVDARTTVPSRGPGTIDRISHPGKTMNGASAVPEEKIRVVSCNLGMEDNNDDLDKQNETAETQVNIPQDAQGIILAFLPGRVVVKCRSVCKFWRDCIEEPSFVDRHLNNALCFHQSIACFTSVARGLVHMYTFDPTTMNFRSVELVFSNRFHISGPCNGLVCAYDFKGTAEVLNPTTRKHLRLPFGELKSQSLYSEYFVGFVHSTKEYKVVSVRHHVQFLTFEMCTIGALSWRIVRESSELLKTSKAVIVNNGMYWLLLHEASSVLSREILMLNLTDEKFSKIAIPEAVKKRDLELFEGGGKLHLLSRPVDRYNNTMSDIWVSDWDRQVWVQLDIISPRVHVGMSPFFLCKMKFFFGNQDSLVCADLLDGTVSHVNMPPGENLISCGMFVESFAPAVPGLVDSVASALSYGSRQTGLCLADPCSSTAGPGQSSDLIGWTASDLVQSLKRAKRTMSMGWKTPKHRGNFSLDLYSCLYG